jgi:hypothetical protein
MITGTCIMVREADENQGIKPQFVSPNSTEMALITPATTIFRVLSLVTSPSHTMNDCNA